MLNGLIANFTVSADRIGGLFEHFIFNQLTDSAAAFDQPIRLSTFRTEHGAELDFVLERGREVVGIEVKASRIVSTTDGRGFGRFADYYGRRFRSIVLYLGRETKRIGSVEILPWRKGLKELGW